MAVPVYAADQQSALGGHQTYPGMSSSAAPQYGTPFVYAGAPPPYPPVTPAYGVSGPAPAAYPYRTDNVASGLENVYGKPDTLPYGPMDVEQAGAPHGGGQSNETMITESIDTAIRHAFVRKVFAILSLQMLITVGLASAFAFVEPMGLWLMANTWLPITTLCVALVLQIAMVCYPSMARRVPGNFIFLSIITVCHSITLSLAAAASNSLIFVISVAITFVVVVALMLFACQTKWDFTGFGAYVFVALVVVLLFGILTIFFRNRIMDLVYSSITALLFCFILVIDTQKVVGGKHRKFQYSVDDYIFAALTLYMDILIILMELLTSANRS